MLLDVIDDTTTNDYCLTTIDNPWNPFTQWDEWYAYDTSMGYRTPERLARMMRTLAVAARVDDEGMVADEAIDELIRLDPLQRYIKVTKDTDCTRLGSNS
ncbi:MAG: hypothetical protein J6U54_13250 [Clostridiales bacterium]|nr:hypothetical protein [Clostridiales bacterium]